MSAQLIDGRKLANQIKQDLKLKIGERVKAGKAAPGLAVILVGDNPASLSYIKHKRQGCDEVGILSHLHHLPDSTTTDELKNLIDQIDQDPTVHGILVQLPLPKQINPNEIVEYIEPKKDVDGFHPYNLGRLTQRRPLLRPCTPFGVMQLLATTKVDLKGKNAVVVGASNIVGRPMALELLSAKCTITVTHRFTADLAQHIQTADILISATGKPGVIDSAWIKPGAIVIDVGFSKDADESIRGDIEFATARERASWITPVPGGVGPMTVATLLQNTLLAANLLKS